MTGLMYNYWTDLSRRIFLLILRIRIKTEYRRLAKTKSENSSVIDTNLLLLVVASACFV